MSRFHLKRRIGNFGHGDERNTVESLFGYVHSAFRKFFKLDLCGLPAGFTGLPDGNILVKDFSRVTCSLNVAGMTSLVREKCVRGKPCMSRVAEKC